MESKYIEDIFEDYLATEKTNYAILINGSWGSGKTYFWKTKLTELSEKANITPVYLSLNGINKIETLDYQLKIKLIPLLNKLDVKKTASAGNLTKNILFEFIKGKWSIDPENIIKDVEIDLTLFSNKIICFDDLERCKVPLSEVLGYVNDFVEHKNLKVIFLSDESKIANIKEENYNSIKEKVVGRILNFKNSLKDTLPLIIEKYKTSDKDFYTFLHSKSDFILSLLSEYKEENLRNIAFYLESLNKIYSTLKNHISYTDEVLLFSLIMTIEFKAGKLTSNDYEDFKGYDGIDSAFTLFNFSKPKENSYFVTNETEKEEPKSELEIFHEKYLQNNITKYHFYASIYQFILTGYLDKEKLSDELKSRYPVVIPKEILAFRKLLNYGFRVLTNDEFPKLSEEVLRYSKEGKYSIYDYLQISSFFNFFSENKLIQVSTQEIQSALSEGIQIAKLREKSDNKLYKSIFHFGRDKDDPVISTLIKEAHNAIEAKKEAAKVNQLIVALAENNHELIKDVFDKYQAQKMLFELLLPKKLFEVLESIENETLSEFNDLIGNRYASSNIKDYLSSDFEFLNELNSFIIEKLNDKEVYQVQDLLFKELSETIKEVCTKLK